MSSVPAELKYTDTHEWVRREEDGTLTVGITDHAQELLGDMVFVELPETNRTLEKAEECAVIESVKAASDIYAPVSGTIREVNKTLEDNPEIINQDTYTNGWLFRIQPHDDSAFTALMDAAAYRALVAESS